MQKLTSRKLIAFAVAFAVFLVNGLLGSPLPEETLDQLLTALLGYLASQGLVDVAAAATGKQAAEVAQSLIDSLKAGDDDAAEPDAEAAETSEA